MKCVICKGEIEVKKTPEGKVYWDSGNDATPVAEGRCCDVCDNSVVLSARLRQIKGA